MNAWVKVSDLKKVYREVVENGFDVPAEIVYWKDIVEAQRHPFEDDARLNIIMHSTDYADRLAQAVE